jgi:hypothetical protein
MNTATQQISCGKDQTASSGGLIQATRSISTNQVLASREFSAYFAGCLTALSWGNSGLQGCVDFIVTERQNSKEYRMNTICGLLNTGMFMRFMKSECAERYLRKWGQWCVQLEKSQFLVKEGESRREWSARLRPLINCHKEPKRKKLLLKKSVNYYTLEGFWREPRAEFFPKSEICKQKKIGSNIHLYWKTI